MTTPNNPASEGSTSMSLRSISPGQKLKQGAMFVHLRDYKVLRVRTPPLSNLLGTKLDETVATTQAENSAASMSRWRETVADGGVPSTSTLGPCSTTSATFWQYEAKRGRDFRCQGPNRTG